MLKYIKNYNVFKYSIKCYLFFTSSILFKNQILTKKQKKASCELRVSTVRVRSRVLVTSSVALVQIVRSEIRLLSSSKVFFTGGVHAPALLSVVSTMYLVQPVEGATGVVCCWLLVPAYYYH